MDSPLIYEIIGYVASVLIAVSMMMSAIVKLRIINMIGAATFSAYGVLIGSIPVAALNGFIVLVNIYFLFRMYRSTEYFKLLQVSPESKYLSYFLDFYQKDIHRFQPDYTYSPGDDDLCIFVLRDMVPAGLFIGKIEQPGQIRVHLDFVIPHYRDFKIGRYLYRDHKSFFEKLNVKEILATAGNDDHSRYLKKMGFVSEGPDQRNFRLSVC